MSRWWWCEAHDFRKYLIPNTFRHWAENFKSLPHYCPVMDWTLIYLEKGSISSGQALGTWDKCSIMLADFHFDWQWHQHIVIDWCWLMTVGADWWWLMQIDADVTLDIRYFQMPCASLHHAIPCTFCWVLSSACVCNIRKYEKSATCKIDLIRIHCCT